LYETWHNAKCSLDHVRPITVVLLALNFDVVDLRLIRLISAERIGVPVDIKITLLVFPQN